MRGQCNYARAGLVRISKKVAVGVYALTGAVKPIRRFNGIEDLLLMIVEDTFHSGSRNHIK